MSQLRVNNLETLHWTRICSVEQKYANFFGVQSKLNGKDEFKTFDKFDLVKLFLDSEEILVEKLQKYHNIFEYNCYLSIIENKTYQEKEDDAWNSFIKSFHALNQILNYYYDNRIDIDSYEFNYGSSNPKKVDDLKKVLDKYKKNITMFEIDLENYQKREEAKKLEEELNKEQKDGKQIKL